MEELTSFFNARFEAILKKMGVANPKEQKFIIVPTEEVEKFTTMDEVYRVWDTPAFSGIRLSYESVLSSLIKKRKKVIPLWIKVHQEKGKPIILQISQRYRKMRDVILRYEDNLDAPFSISEDPMFEFSEAKERAEAIKILFFTRKFNDDLSHSLGKAISYKEVKNNFKHHFENYRFYPAAFNHVKESEGEYSNLIIDKDLKTNKFNIFRNPDIETRIKSNLNLDEAARYYVEEELKYKICGVEIKQKIRTSSTTSNPNS